MLLSNADKVSQQAADSSLTFLPSNVGKIELVADGRIIFYSCSDNSLLVIFNLNLRHKLQPSRENDVGHLVAQ